LGGEYKFSTQKTELKIVKNQRTKNMKNILKNAYAAKFIFLMKILVHPQEEGA